MKRLYSLGVTLIIACALASIQNTDKASAQVYTRNFVASTPTGTVTPGVITNWVPMTQPGSGGSGGGGTSGVTNVSGTSLGVTLANPITLAAAVTLANPVTIGNQPVTDRIMGDASGNTSTPFRLYDPGSGLTASVTALAQGLSSFPNSPGVNVRMIPYGTSGQVIDGNLINQAIQLPSYNFNYAFNNTSEDRLRTIQGATTLLSSIGGLGVMAAAAPDFTQGPVTFTATGSVTYGPYFPMAATHLFQYITTGTITAASVTWYASNDGLSIDSTNGVLASSVLASFAGAYEKPIAALPARYIIQKVTITTLGGTNIITQETDGK